MVDTPFKSSLFGGFCRKDVIDYIEKSASEANERIDALEKDLDALTAENHSLRDEVTSVSGARDRLSEALHDNYEAQEKLRAELDTANAELENVRAELAALRAERDALKNEVETLRPQAEEFSAVKENLTELELAARLRADEYDAAVRGKADDYDRETRVKVNDMLSGVRARCDVILATLSETCANVTQQLDESRVSIARLPAAFHTLRHDLDDLGKPEN